MSYDYVVVGGGIYGCATAWELARRGARVVVLEARTVASGASGGPGKRGVRACGRDPRELPLMQLAYDLWPALADEIGAATGYERTGGLHLFEREPDGLDGGWASSPGRAWAQNQRGIATEILERDAVRALEPDVCDAVSGALYCPNDGIADHTATTRGLATAAARLGAEIREGTAVVGLERAGDRVTAVVTAEGERIAVGEAALLLTNTRVSGFVREALGVTLPVWPMLPQVLLTEPLDPPPVRHLIGHEHRTLAIKPLPGGQVMISGGWRGRWDAQAEQGEAIPAQVEGNLAEAAAAFPALVGVRLAESDAARPESVCVDDIPIIDRLPGATNLIVGTGWSGHGFAISLAVAKLLADWATGAERPEPLRPFAYDRFLA
ncbi:MAG TPA: FAD-binding oxidoreductase [Ktedonobacterales bacterium]|nr:FAD-binding oxidoreductase [Ktedonobacterales bacterium]